MVLPSPAQSSELPLPERLLLHQPPILQLQPQYLAFASQIAKGDAGVAVEEDAVVVVGYLRKGEEGGDDAGHAADVGEEHCLAFVQITLVLAFQSGVDQFGAGHVAGDQQDAGLVVEGVGRVELIQPRSGCQAVAGLHRQCSGGQQAQQHQNGSFHAV